MAVHHSEVVADDRAVGAQPYLLDMAAPDDLEGREDHAWYWVAWPGWGGHRAERRVTVVVPQD